METCFESIRQCAILCNNQVCSKTAWFATIFQASLTAIRSEIIPAYLSPVSHLEIPASGTPSGSEYGAIATADSLQTPNAVRDLAPYEALACALLTDEIRAHTPGLTFAEPLPYRPPAFHAETLEAAIRHAASIITFNAKWFAPDALADLILATLEAAFASSSSAVLYATLDFISTVGTYSVLPTVCLVPMIRFLAYAYHQGRRANRLKRLSERAWTVADRIKQSHIGDQLVDALLDIIRADLTILDGRTGFATTVGALMIISERVLPGDENTIEFETTDLLLSLKNAAISYDEMIKEQVGHVLGQVLRSQNLLLNVERSGSWDVVLETIERCIAQSPNNAESHMLIKALEPSVSTLEARHLPTLARLFLDANLPLPPPLRAGIATAWRAKDLKNHRSDDLWSTLEKLLSSSIYTDEASLIISKDMRILATSDDIEAVRARLCKYETYLRQSTKTPSAATAIGTELVKAFARCMEVDDEPWRPVLVFEALCDTADCSVDVAQFLFLLRADVTGVVCFRAGGTASSFKILYDAQHLPVDKWLKVLPSIFKHGAHNWETFECHLTNLKGLLSNHQMFENHIDIIKALGSTICDRLEQGTVPEPPSGAAINKSGVTSHLVQILTTLLSYHRHLTKQEVLSIITIFNSTAGSGDPTVSKHCVHALTICCYDVPGIMSSYMEDVIDKMSKMVTQKFLAIHVLQFLAGLSRLPDLYHNFQQNDYKKIFGVCYSYLHSTRGVTTSTQRTQTPVSESSSTVRNEEALPEYVYALAHHVIVFWYMALRGQDQESLKQYIAGCLTYNDAAGAEKIEEQGLVTLDLMDRVDAESRSGSMLVRYVKSFLVRCTCRVTARRLTDS